jgi:hypothetical protein
MLQSKFDQFKNIIANSFESKNLISLRLLDNKSGDNDLKQIIVKPIELKTGYQLQFVFRHKTKDITKNYTLDEALNVIQQYLIESFHQAELITTTEIQHLSRTNTNNWKIKIKTAESQLKSLEHNKQKKYLIPASAPYLFHLGVTNESGMIRSAMHSKFKQINKFIEIISTVVDKADLSKEFSVLDMGSGKGYLSFALFDYLSRENKDKLKITGIELRGGLVKTCNNISDICDYHNLNFVESYIQDFKIENLGMLIALHACNTATDDAIFKGINSNAKYIICSPCCHKQIRNSMHEEGAITSITRHGILKERQAEILTDTIRALILEAHGYKTNIMEFISSEHTSKNLLIVAKKTQHLNKPNPVKVQEIESLKAIFGIKRHYLQELTKI